MANNTLELTTTQNKYFRLILACGYDQATSRKQLQLSTQDDKVVVENVLKQLKELGLIRLTDTWVVNLSAAGKKYAGNEQSIHIKAASEQDSCSLPGPVPLPVAKVTPKPRKTRKKTTKQTEKPVFSSINQLENKLKVQLQPIGELDLKCKVLTRLSGILDQEISDVLTDIKQDLTAINASATTI
ncbi:hypothetical protein SG34_010405 [Thalassomonas viridans]|uniref:Uncharacterized protein n=1 Tax=Thalassomonas viridans TaxID=137584 RepID=A0AAF0C994_9GAMM|nr:hypothetical protein [Thalassomonas viridans]WDE07257.1 hypothetical protein SG34_010405 [Thalassomonas viridans]